MRTLSANVSSIVHTQHEEKEKEQVVSLSHSLTLSLSHSLFVSLYNIFNSSAQPAFPLTRRCSGKVDPAADAEVVILRDGRQASGRADRRGDDRQRRLHHVRALVNPGVGEQHVLDDQDVAIPVFGEGELIQVDGIVDGKSVVGEELDVLQVGRLLDPNGRRLGIALERDRSADRNRRVQLLDAGKGGRRQGRDEQQEEETADGGGGGGGGGGRGRERGRGRGGRKRRR